MKESGLLTAEVQKQNPLCYAFLEYSSEIKDRYMAMVEMKHEMEEDSKALSMKSTSRLMYPDNQGSGPLGSSRSKLGNSPWSKVENSPRTKSERRTSR
ncbi:hypothetical protein L7F22_064233 [Adiantum nelumboides]|nr:hypothetical protein [Adiantum nelumboides]